MVISSRYGIAVSILLALALVPTILHSYLGLAEQDGLSTRTISSNLAGFQSKPTDRKPKWIKKIFDAEDWIEREYTTRDGKRILLFAARAYDLKRLYHHPELAILYGIDFVDAGVMQLPQSPNTPIRLLQRRTGLGAAVYALLYDGQFVSNPILFQLRTALELVFRPRKPITLFLVYDDNMPSDQDLESSPAVQLLLDAIESFRNQEAKVSLPE